MKIKLFIIDVNYQVVGREPHILLWGITDKGERVVVRETRFRPYFYILPREGVNLNKLIERIKRLQNPKSPIIGLDVVEKKYYGRPRKVIKLTTLIPDQVPKYRDEIKKLPEVEACLEADIRFYMRYIIDYGLQPCSWHEAEVEEVKKTPGFHIDREYKLVGYIKPVEIVQRPKLKILAFDIEVYNPLGNPVAVRDPVIIISTVNSEGERRQFIAKDRNDRDVLRSFVNYVLEYDPDIIVGYNSNRFDWPYLVDRGKYVGVRISIARNGGEPAQSVHGHISIVGRANVDLYDFAEEIPEVKVKTLENVADYLGVMPKDKRVIIHWTEIPEYWDNLSKRPIFLKYAMQDAESTYGLAEKFLPFAMQLSSLTGLTLDQVGAASVGYRVEWFLMREAYKANELVPNRVERAYETYRGAIVLEPKRGIHENVAVLDFSSMYPNIMIKYNVGPDTYVKEYENIPDSECWIAPEVKHRFRKSPPGFFKRVLTMLITLRKEVRKLMKNYPPDSPEYRLYDERQKALKILANAMYGYMGWTGARWYCKPAAEAVTAWGRETIRKAIAIAKELGLEVIYGDTDSLFIKYDEVKVKKFIERVEKELGFEIKVDKIYKRVFFTEAKKRYCGLLTDGRIDIVGFEAIRGDWADIAKEVQEKVIEIVLKEGSVNKAVDYVRNIISMLKHGEIPIDKLIIWKTLTKRLEEYAVDAPHVVAAKRLIEAGGRVTVGEKIGYVIVKGSGKLSERAMPYFMAKSNLIDVDYYINRQIIPAALRILEYFGVTERTLKTVATGIQRTLFDFFKR